jgi:hypothetical protein
MSIEQLFAYINAAFCLLMYINTASTKATALAIRITLFYAKQVPVETFMRRGRHARHAYVADGKAFREMRHHAHAEKAGGKLRSNSNPQRSLAQRHNDCSIAATTARLAACDNICVRRDGPQSFSTFTPRPHQRIALTHSPKENCIISGYIYRR